MKTNLQAELVDCLEEVDGSQAFNMLTYSELYTNGTYILSKDELKAVIDELLTIHGGMRD